MNTYEEIGRIIRQKRIEMGLSQIDFAKLVGTSSTAISMYELGERTPDLEMLSKIAQVLNIPQAELLGLKENKQSLNIALRSQRLDADEVDEVKQYIEIIKDKKIQKANRHKARNLAQKILRENNITEAPILLAMIIRHLGIHAEAGRSTDRLWKKVSAFIELESKILVYNPNDPVVRQRFSVAHEIGHYVLGHNIGEDIFDMDSTDPREVEANMFAAELLMPFDMVKTDMQQRNMNIKQLADKYLVSEEAMGWRLFKSDALLLA